MADAIFISYRRDDSEGEAGRLFDDLTRAFGNDAVFMDVTGIKPGVDFRHAIEDNVASCGVLLAVVGRTWATIATPDGKRRLEDPSDFVALEIASALKREVPVIPILVHEAKMPPADLLPEDLKSFAYHNSVEISHARWSSDVALLIEALKQYVTPKTASESTVRANAHASAPIQPPAPHHPTSTVEPTVPKNRLPMLISALVGVVLIVAIISYFLFRPRPDTKAAITPVTTSNAISDQQSPSLPDTASAATASAAAAPAPTTLSVPVVQPAPAKPAHNRAEAIASATPAPVIALSPAPSTATTDSGSQPAAGQFAGTWTLPAAPAGASNTLSKLVISPSGSGFIIHAYGSCLDTACDWGSQPGVLRGSNLVAKFSPPPGGSDTSRTAMMTLRPVQGRLDVVVHNTFQNPAGSRTNVSHRIFVSTQ